MTQAVKKRSKKAGLPPGTLVYIGDKSGERSSIAVATYDENEFHREEVETPEACALKIGENRTCWINVTGIHQSVTIEQIGELFHIHPLLLEDVMNTDQRPKFEMYDDYLFVVLRVLIYDERQGSATTEQVSIVLESNYVISFQESESNIFNSILERLEKSKGKIRKQGADYLVYTLIDVTVGKRNDSAQEIGMAFAGSHQRNGTRRFSVNTEGHIRLSERCL